MHLLTFVIIFLLKFSTIRGIEEETKFERSEFNFLFIVVFKKLKLELIIESPYSSCYIDSRKAS